MIYNVPYIAVVSSSSITGQVD